MSAERPFLKKNFAGIVDDTLASLRSGVGGRVVLDDGTEGSVLRTLVEAFSRELAVCYEQLDAVYMAGYLDTASGAALERVVELLGVQRHQAGWLEGDVVFSRATPASSNIEIPAGTLVAGKGVQAFETLAPAKLLEGESSVRVPVRSLVPEGDPVDPGKLSLLKRPIPGVERVTNPGLLLPRREPESDDDLRTRARNAIRGGRTATISAIERAVLALGIVEVSVFEDPERAGLVNVVIGDLDLTQAELDQAAAAVEEVRPVGVRVNAFPARPVWIRVRATVVLDEDLDNAAKASVRAQLEQSVAGLFDNLSTNETARWNKIRNLLAAHEQVAEVLAPTRQPTQDEQAEQASDAPVPTWPLHAIYKQSGELESTTPNGEPRLLGQEKSPVGVFIAADERARLLAVEIDLQSPELPVWIDVDGVLTAGKDKAQSEAKLKEVLLNILPTNTALANPLSFTWDELITQIGDQLALANNPQVGVELPTLRFVVLHDRDGRVVTVANNASEEINFITRERLEIRSLTLTSAS